MHVHVDTRAHGRAGTFCDTTNTVLLYMYFEAVPGLQTKVTCNRCEIGSLVCVARCPLTKNAILSM